LSLSAAEQQHYQTHGYVIPEYTLPAAQLESLRNALEDVLAANPDVRPEKLVSVHLSGQGGEGVAGHQAFLDIAKDPKLLDIVEGVLGPDIILWGCHAFCKPGVDGLEVPWHQDGQYWPIRPLATCTVWIAIDASDRENGCLRVLPGSQRAQTLFDHYVDEREDLTLTNAIEPHHMEDHEPADVELEPGQMSLHDIYMVHGSNANRSPRRRAGLAIRYMPATSLFDRDMYRTSDASGFLVDFSRRPLWLLRGEDKNGGNNFEIGHFPQEHT
jgi:hypothetical protein|tara:strand:+ start:3941 stop:4753 length:813 start_codon:yes stop_codon:yes gene_type:complete